MRCSAWRHFGGICPHWSGRPGAGWLKSVPSISQTESEVCLKALRRMPEPRKQDISKTPSPNTNPLTALAHPLVVGESDGYYSYPRRYYYFSCFLFYLNFPEVVATKPARKRFSDKVFNEFRLHNKEKQKRSVGFLFSNKINKPDIFRCKSRIQTLCWRLRGMEV